MTKKQITTAMKDTSEPVVLRELAQDEDHGAALALIRSRAPDHVGVYLRRASMEREDGRVVGLTPAAIMGRVKVA